MTRVLHLLDASCHETHAQVLETLRARLAERGGQIVAGISPKTNQRLAPHIDTAIVPTPLRWLGRANLAPSLRAIVGRERPDVIHAWGIDAAAAARAAAPETPMVLALLDPTAADDAARMSRSFDRPVAMVAGSQCGQRRLLTAGVPADAVTVVRSPVDFGRINRAKQAGLRASLAGDAGPVVLLHGPAVREHGHFEGVWACAIVRQIHPNLRVILPYASPERGRVARHAVRMTHPQFAILPDARWSWAELATAADVFLIPARTDVSTESLAYAMAGGAVCVGCAVHSVAEILADRHNGLLSRDASVKHLSDALLRAIEDKALARQVSDMARSQAFEVFGVRAFVDNYARAYENVAAGRPVGDGVSDTAMVA